MKISKINLYNQRNTASFTAEETSRPEEIEIISTRKAKPVFDINKELANQTFIRPLPSKGHIIRDGILDAPKTYVQDLKYDMKALSDAAKGNANDHQLGKLNDLGLKVGGLAIAGYLFSARKAPVTKWMEFVGLGSFLGSMALWPKIALELPCRVLNGFNPFMQYEDSRGCKKPFFQDNQYIPFDMLSDRDINRIGNKLNVPENLFNRRDAVQEKMRQIALQNNTMWMLTAGFATPVMSALICNRLEPIVDNVQNFFLNKKLDKLLSNFNDYSTKYKTDDIQKNLDKFLAAHANKPISDETVSLLTDVLTAEMDPNVKIGVRKDLQKLLETTAYELRETSVKPIQQSVSDMLKYAAGKRILPQNLKEIIPSEEQIMKKFRENKYFDGTLTELDLDQVKRDLIDIVSENIANAESSGSSIDVAAKDALIESLFDIENPAFSKTEKLLRSTPVKTLDENMKRTLQGFAKQASLFSAENRVLSEYSYKRLAQAPNTSKAKFWNDTLESVVKLLGITSEEIKDTRYDRTLVGELFNQKIWQFATSDSAAYEKFVESLAGKIAQIDKNLKPEELTGKYIEQLKKSLENSAENFRKLGFENTAKKLYVKSGNQAGTLYGISKAFVEDNLSNVKNTFSAILNKAAVYRLVFKDPEMSFIDGANIPKEVKEEILAMVEYLTTEGRIADYSVKFEPLRNLHPDQTKGKVDIIEGKGVKYAFYDAQKLAEKGTFIPSDDYFFRRVMKTLFDAPITSETSQILSKYPAVDKMLKDYRKNMYYEVGNSPNFMYPHKNVTGTSTATPKFKSNAAGTALDEMFANALRQKYNTQRWLKMFGTFGAGLLAFTVGTQFFFGRGFKLRHRRGGG